MKAIILCAGKGERLKPLTDNIPKPMVLINGKPLLEYNIELCKKHGIKDIAINTSYLPEKIKEYFQDGKKFGVNLHYSFEPELLGTSGALNNFREFLDETFIVIYGDAVTDINIKEMFQYHKQKNSLFTTALRKKPKESKAASFVVINEKNQVANFIEKPSEELFNQLCKDFYFSSSGIYILEPQVLEHIPQGFSDFALDIIPKLIKENKKVYGFMMDDYYFREIGKIEKYQLAKEEIESGKIKLSFLSEEETTEKKGKNKAVFLDRDNTINEILYEVDGKLMSPANLEQLKILPNVKEGIQKMKKLGFKIIAISNQPGIAFGYLRKEKLEEIENFLQKELGIDAFYSCLHHPKDNCECRKPKPFLILKAAEDSDIDLNQSYMAGDNLSDIQTGKNAGVKKTFRIGTIREDILELQHKRGIYPDFTLPDLLEVAKKIEEIEKHNL